MTPKEKAKELVINFYKLRNRPPLFTFWKDISIAKKSALIVVDEIQKELFDAFQGFIGDKRKTFWEKVKEEIIKL